MGTTYRVLGQVSPGAAALADLYIVPAGAEAVVSTLVVANRSVSTTASYRIAISPDGATLSNEHYIAFDVPLPPAESATITLGLTVDANDKIIVYSSNSNLSFNLFGMELS